MRLSRLSAILATAAAVAVVEPLVAGFAGTDVFLPSVGRKAGSNSSQWYTMLWIHNPSATAAHVTISFLLRNQPNPSPAAFLDSIPPGDSRDYPDTVTTLFNTQAWGALRITSDVRVLATCRMYNLPAGGQDRDTQGQDYNAIPAAFAIGQGQSTKLLGVHQTNPKSDSQFRYSFGWVESAGGTADVQVTALDETGAQVATKVYPRTGTYEARYYPIEDLVPNVNSADLTLVVSVVNGTGKVIAVGSGTANVSNDSTTFEMAFADSLLGGAGGLSAVAHDPSLIGDGTAPSPLGLADGGVTKAKLAAGGGSNGQVLGTDGSNLVWQNAGAGGLTLPYDGTASTGANAFAVTNNGLGGTGIYAASVSGPALWATTALNNAPAVFGENTNTGTRGYIADQSHGVWGIAAGGDGVTGKSTNGVGVVAESQYGAGVLASSSGSYGVVAYSSAGDAVAGQSTNGAGVHGISINADGVFGESGAAGKSGVFALNTNPNGYAGFFSGHVRIVNGFFSVAGLSAGSVCSDVTGVLTTCGSDARLKRGVRDLAADLDVLAALKRLRGVTFNWDASVERVRNMGDRRELGMIAQEVEEVLPEVVAMGKDGYRTLDYARLTAFLVEVNKAQQARLDDQERKIRAQQAELGALRAQLRPLLARLGVGSATAPSGGK